MMRRMVVLVLAGAAVRCGGCSDEALPPAVEPNARRITAADELIGGLEATGRVGDWLIANEHVRFIVQDAGSATGWGLYGGSLVDLALTQVDPDTGDGDDRLQELFFQCDLRAFAADRVEVVVEEGRSILRLHGHDAGIPLLDAVLPSEPLDLETTIDLILPPQGRTLEIVQRAHDGRKREPRDLDCGPVLIQGDSLALFSNGAGEDRAEFGAEVPWLAAASRDASASFVFYRAQDNLRLLAGALPAMVMQTGRAPFLANDSRQERYFLSVGAGGDIESALAERRRVLEDQRQRQTVEFSIVAPPLLSALEDRISIAINDVAVPGSPRGRTATFAAAKRAAVELLPGKYEAVVTFGDWTVDRVELEVTDPGGAPQQLDVSVGGLGAIAIESQRVDIGGAALGRTAAKIVLVQGHDMPRTGGQFLRRYVAPTDQIIAPEGQYTLFASRGPEYDLFNANVTVTAGESTSVSPRITHVVDTTGWVSADMHVHGTKSMDATPARKIRVIGAIAEGLDILVSTDHDITSDYGPTAVALGLDDLLTTVSGIEASPLVAHINGYPVPAESPERYWDVRWFEYDDADRLARKLEPVDVVQALRDKGAQVVHLNHPRDTGAFAYLRLDSSTGELGRGEWPAADAFELMNGTGDSDIPQLLDDWASLIRTGKRITAVGVSDAHGEFGVGYSRTFIRSPSADVAKLGLPALWKALRDGHAIAMNGPFVTLSGHRGGASAEIGQTLDAGAPGPIELRVQVQAPPWMHVGTLRILENGAALIELDIPQSEDVLRLDTTLTATPAADAWYIAIVEGERRNQPVMGSQGRTITNPVFVDTNGDGFRYQ